MAKEYALYKGDEYIYSGTAKEIAEHQNITIGTVRFYGTKSYMKRVRKGTDQNYKILIKLDDD